MALEKLGLSLVKKTSAWVKAAGKTSILQTKPINPTKLQSLVACDTVQLSNTSYLSDSFVKSLTQIKGKDSSDTAKQVINSILKKMGYKHPEALKVEIDSFEFRLANKLGSAASFNFEPGKLYLSKEIIDLPIKQQISTLYHELDHIDKFVKLYKAVGEKQFQKFLVEAKKNSPFYDLLLKRGISTDMVVNNDFYRRMGEGINIQNFDVKKWSKAVREYSGMTTRYCDQYKYYNNPLEVSAYNLESKINKILGLPIETPRDLFPKNYTSIIDSLKRQGITDVLEQEKIVQEAINTCRLKHIDNRLVGLYRKKINGEKLTSDELKLVEQICSDFDKELGSNLSIQNNFIQKACSDAELCINKGLFTRDAIIRSMG